MRLITAELVEQYIAERSRLGVAAKTSQNTVSTINIVLAHATDGHWRRLSPAQLAGSRDDVRRVAPVSLDNDAYLAACDAILRFPRAHCVYRLARAFGLRSREASLGNIQRWCREADKYGAINVTAGTKGGRGRSCPRWVSVTERGQHALQAALRQRPVGSKNLLRPSESYQQWRDGELRRGRDALHGAGVTGYHDARAAYACERYRQAVGVDAPAVSGRVVSDKRRDRVFRQTLAYELGHGRIAITTSYVGSRK